MNNNKLKTAIIGAGMISNFAHIPAYNAFSDLVTIEAICDLNKNNAIETASRFQIEHFFTDVSTMLKKIRPDIVSICTPNATHFDLVKKSIEADANVICEKPLALNYKDTKFLFDLAKQHDRILVSCQTSRFKRTYTAVKEYIEQGLFGDIYYSEINRIRRRGFPTWGTFHKKSWSGGGAMADIGVHALDALLWIIGSPQILSVNGYKTSQIIKSEKNVIYNLEESGAFAGIHNTKPFNPDECDVEEFASGMIRASNEISINFKIAWAANHPNSNEFTILGNKMGIRLPDMNIYSVLGGNQVNMVPRLFEFGKYDEKNFSGHYYLIENFLNVLLDRDELIVRPEETINVSKAIDLFYRSCSSGKEAFATELM